jgi:hypothetical protein
MPFDISLRQLVTSLILMALGAPFILPLWTLIAVCKFIPGLVRVWDGLRGEISDKAEKEPIGWSIGCAVPIVILFVVLAPVGSAVFLALEVLHGVGVVLAIPFVYYYQNSIWYTLWYMPMIVREFDVRTSAHLASVPLPLPHLFAPALFVLSGWWWVCGA